MKITTLPELKRYLHRLMPRVEHHAHYARTLVAPLLQAVIMLADEGSISVIEGPIRAGSQVRFSYLGTRWKLRANHKEEAIQLIRVDGVYDGPLRREFHAGEATHHILDRLREAVETPSYVLVKVQQESASW